MVATPEDTASARLGENIYRFALREIPGAVARAWSLERKRLSGKGLPFWHWRNGLLPGYALSLAIAAILIAAFGWIMVPFLAIHHTRESGAICNAAIVSSLGMPPGLSPADF